MWTVGLAGWPPAPQQGAQHDYRQREYYPREDAAAGSRPFSPAGHTTESERERADREWAARMLEQEARMRERAAREQAEAERDAAAARSSSYSNKRK